MAYEASLADFSCRDRIRAVAESAIDRAEEPPVLNRVTHLDELSEKLGEKRVRDVILPLLAGSTEWDWRARDLERALDLGLVALNRAARIANPIYAEVATRDLTYSSLQSVDENVVEPGWYVNDDDSLDVAGLLTDCRACIREHSESWVDRHGNREAGPQLVLHAYLERVANRGGCIEREYGLGRRRTDLLMIWPLPDSCEVRYLVECKVLRPGRGPRTVVANAVRQTAAYVDIGGADSGHLVVFDLRKIGHRQSASLPVRSRLEALRSARGACSSSGLDICIIWALVVARIRRFGWAECKMVRRPGAGRRRARGRALHRVRSRRSGAHQTFRERRTLPPAAELRPSRDL